MHMGCLLIVCSYCCLHLNPIWSELSPRSSPHPQSSAAWWQRFPLRRFLFVALRGLSPLSLQNDSECLRLVNPAAGAREAREKGRRGEGDVRSPAPGGTCPRSLGPQLRGCSSHLRAVGERLGAFPSPYQDSWGSTIDTAAGSDLKAVAFRNLRLKKTPIYLKSPIDSPGVLHAEGAGQPSGSKNQPRGKVSSMPRQHLPQPSIGSLRQGTNKVFFWNNCHWVILNQL